MSANSKRFCVMTFASSDRGEGCWEFVLVAQDGECWEIVCDSEGPFLLPGDEIEIPLVMVAGSAGDREMVPSWGMLNVITQGKCHLDDPYEIVCQVWGDEIAKKFFAPPRSFGS